MNMDVALGGFVAGEVAGAPFSVKSKVLNELREDDVALVPF
jgi:hypothetical protein